MVEGDNSELPQNIQLKNRNVHQYHPGNGQKTLTTVGSRWTTFLGILGEVKRHSVWNQ